MRWLLVLMVLWLIGAVATELWMFDCKSNSPLYHDDLVVIGCKPKR